MSRNAYALDQLVIEVGQVDDTIEVEYGEPDGFDVVREVTFTTATKSKPAKLKLDAINRALNLGSEDRLARTEFTPNSLTVALVAGSDKADSRKHFGLVEAVHVLEGGGNPSEGEGEDEPPVQV